MNKYHVTKDHSIDVKLLSVEQKGKTLNGKFRFNNEVLAFMAREESPFNSPNSHLNILAISDYEGDDINKKFVENALTILLFNHAEECKQKNQKKDLSNKTISTGVDYAL